MNEINLMTEAYSDLLNSIDRNYTESYQRRCARALLRADARAHWAGADHLLAREIAFIASLAIIAGRDGIARFQKIVQSHEFVYAQCLADLISAMDVERFNDIVYFVEYLMMNASLREDW